MAFESGTRLGPYEVVEPIPAAAGERYKATDTRSNRIVAITVLPSGFAGRPDARSQLERDARTISSLERSHISGLIEIGHQDPSTDFVVAEFVEGETLAARIAAGPIEVSEALEIGVSIARSLDQAHRQGVFHGGLTPSTIMLTEEGPKLLDFGLAAVLDDSSIEPPVDGSEGQAGGTTNPSMATTRSLTVPMSAPPHAAYMAPERLAGGASEARTDIFAFGAILYEMLSGRPAFEEKTPALLVAAVQTVEPEPVSTLQPMAPAALDHVIARCLAKDPARRIQTAWDLMHQLQWVAEGGSQVGIPLPVAARRKVRDRAIWGALAVGLVAAAVLAPRAWETFSARPDPGAVRFPLPLLPGPETGAPVSISPDGQWVARSTGAFGLAVQALDAVNPEVVAPDIVFLQPFWSPDSRSIAFFDNDDGFLKRIDVAGGPATTIVEVPQPFSPGGWNQDGVILFASRGIIHRVPAAGGDATPVTALDESNGETEHRLPSFLPDGNHFLYTAVSGEGTFAYVGALDSQVRTPLFEVDAKVLYAEPGHILFNRGDTLFAQPFDAGRLELTGEPLRVVVGLMTVPDATPGLLNRSLGVLANFAVSQTGALAFVTATEGGAGGGAAPASRVLEWHDSNGGVETVGPVAAYAGLDLHPDDSAVAVHVHDGAVGGDISTFIFEQGRPQGLTYNESQHNQSPVWSPDGERIAFVSQRNNQWGLYVKSADGTGPEELVAESGAPKTLTSWSPDDLLVYLEGGVVRAVSVDADSEPFVVLEAPYLIRFPTVSPAGDWFAYASNETGDGEIYVQQFPEGPTKRIVSLEGGLAPRWRADGRELYYVGDGGIWAVELDIDGDSIQPGIPRLVVQVGGLNPGQGHVASDHRFAPTADGSRFLVNRFAGGGGAEGGGIDAAFIAAIDDAAGNLAALGGAGDGESGTVNVILNWPQMLEER